MLYEVITVGGFNRLQLSRYLKQRNKPATLATRYGPAELQRYRTLNDIICLLNKLKN